MIKFDDVTKSIKEHNPNRTQILYYPYRILIIGGPQIRKNKLII